MVTDRLSGPVGNHYAEDFYDPRAKSKDMVNHPSHYTAGKVEVIDYILQVTKDYPGSEAALVGNIIKYISRAPHKGKKREDLEKARWYLNKLLEIT